MSERIDVLAVMDACGRSNATHGDFDRLKKARAAVAELIEAAELMARPHATDVELFNAMPRLRAGLARVGAA